MSTPPAKVEPGKGLKKAEPRHSLVEEFAAKHAIDPVRVLPLLRATAFRVKKDEAPATDEELLQLMLVARVYNLNPFTKEIYAFRSKLGGLVPIIGVDGWVRLVEAQPHFKGHEERFGFDDTLGPKGTELGFYAECVIHRDDRTFPITHRAYYNENKRNTDIWDAMPLRMLGHRAYIQCARRAFGFGGIYDDDEGETIAVGPGVDVIRPSQARAPDPPRATVPKEQAEDPFATDDQLVQIGELLAKTGVPDNLVLARFEVGEFKELRSAQVADVIKFIQDNAP